MLCFLSEDQWHTLESWEHPVPTMGWEGDIKGIVEYQSTHTHCGWKKSYTLDGWLKHVETIDILG